jgi:hypothetical protein
MTRLIQDGNFNADQAELHLTSVADADALREYIVSSNIGIEIIPEHKEYSSLPGRRSVPQDESHRYLLKRISAQHQMMKHIKSAIQEDNERWGVKAAVIKGSSDHELVKISAFCRIERPTRQRDEGRDTLTSNRAH